MRSKNAERITQIRFKVRRERALVADIDGRIVDRELKRTLLDPAIDHLDNAEHLHLPKAGLQEARALEALDRAQASLDAAVERRRHAQAAVEKFGADATPGVVAQQRA
jgi:hypothetical protein